jgi:peptidyl-tRNA hydrolase
MENNLKMYILIKDITPDYYAPNCAAHASLACYLKFQDHPDTKEWVKGSFRKVTCKVNEKEWERALLVEDHVVLTESGVGNQEVIAAFRPRSDWPKNFNFFRMWKPN